MINVTLPAGIEIEKLPFVAVVVEAEEPLTVIEAPGTSVLSVELITLPVTVLVCENPCRKKMTRKHVKRCFNLFISVFCFGDLIITKFFVNAT